MSEKDKAPEEPANEKWENIVAVSVVIIGILGFLFLFYGKGLIPQEQTDNPLVQTSIGGEPVKGDINAPITIVEYSDFQCPFCGKWYKEVYPKIKDAFIDTGRAKMVFKQFPLTQIHPYAMGAAVASECAYQQDNDLFWTYHDLLYENQNDLSDENLKFLADEAGLNALQFDLCYSNLNTKPEVENDFSEGREAGITGTPGFVIGDTSPNFKGELVIGAQPFEKFVEIIG